MINFEPIGIFFCEEKYSYDTARQGKLADDNYGYIELHPSCNYEQALLGLDEFSHIWLIFSFHKNQNWKPLVIPPRGTRKIGVFACRAPYRPNPIGMSVVKLVQIKKRSVFVASHDLLNNTPILDIKPYIPYADSVPNADSGWLEELEEDEWHIQFCLLAEAQLTWLSEHNVSCIRGFLKQQLTNQPTNNKRKRVRKLTNNDWEISYRTWRIRFTIDNKIKGITVKEIYSAYTPQELCANHDPYKDKEIHRNFNNIHI